MNQRPTSRADGLRGLYQGLKTPAPHMIVISWLAILMCVWTSWRRVGRSKASCSLTSARFNHIPTRGHFATGR